ncbi:hypothetical protein OAH27_00415 [Saprospiraceae bacterium]|jgi:hypothetical protein|nr:hypothetical protein [Saprospiraceae bacterium]MDA9332926.1 hypothetical protein [Saprospiraceae bacterium]MDB4824122.1 hypothetical protein [Saprospiraceae bacterium]MDG1101249.1 hypothetical protein [Saprospiraceae bacterium]HCV51666.1 hypothetical protein [Saprospirales bacterium]|tara:strand:- start:7018 stop:8469 length:1452 start_codon:yes stop_codon:yes gene_type:complete
MKNFLNPLILMFGIFALVTFTSCGDDDVVIDTGGDGINVSNGLYLAATGADPSSTAALSAENVGAPDFSAAPRDGYNAGYMWLEAGSYNVVVITEKEVTATIGGTLSVEDDGASLCDGTSYMRVETAVDGPAFDIGTSGLYKVAHDAMRNELILFQITNANLIGAATPNGWGGDTPMTGSITTDGGSFSIEDVVLRAGQMKLRFDCRWDIKRLIDPNGGLDASNGYEMFTNFGGSFDDLQPGGANIEVAEDGLYTITLDWDPRDGWSATQTRTGDAPTLSFDPNDFNWGIIGDATAGSWDTDRDMLYKDGGNGSHNWFGVVTLAADGQFKLRANDAWDLNLGGTLMPDGVASTLVNGGDNLSNPGAGAYYIVLNTSDDGATWNATMTNLGWSIIGAGGPAGSWDMDTDMVAEGFDAGITTYSYTGDFTDGEWKIRAGHNWDLNLGGSASALVLDGGNLSVGTAGTYTVTMTFDGSNYAATIVQ